MSRAARDGRAHPECDTVVSDGENTSSQFHIDEARYCMTHHRKAIIFNHESFLSKQTRCGTEVDCEKLKETLGMLGFTVEVILDGTKDEVLKVLQKESGNEEHKETACLLIVVLTHGKENGVLCAKDGDYNFHDVWSSFQKRNCRLLLSTPKIFIVQACRGSQRTSLNVEIATDATCDDPAEENGVPMEFPAEPDFLVAYSTFDERISVRHIEKGTWYISELCRELQKNWKNDDLLTMLTRVHRNVASKTYEEKNDTWKQMPIFTSTLRKKVYFNDVVESSNPSHL